jgi:hypothetical protein
MLNKISPPFAVSAAGASASSGTIVFSNSNGVSFGQAGSTVTASVSVPSGGVSFSAGASSANLSSVVFSNSNGVSFGLNGSTITATVATNYLTTAALSGDTTKYAQNWKLTGNTAGTTSSAFGTDLWIAGGNNITISGNSNSITISGANAGGAQTGISSIIASDATYTSGMVSFSNAGNITIGSSVNGATQYIKLSGNAAQTNQSAIKGLGVSNTGQTAGNTGLSTGIDWVMAGSQSITLSQSTAGGGPNTIWFQHPAWLTTAMLSNAATITAVNLSAGATSNNLTAFVFSNSNNVSFGLNGSTVTATITVPAQTNQAGNNYALGNTSGTSSGTFDARTLSISAGGNISIAASNSGWILSGGGGASQSVSFYAGSNTFGTSSGTGVASALSIHGNGALSVAASNSGWELSVPSTSSLSGTGGIQISTNGSTISVGLSPQSVSEPFPILTGTAYSSHAPASWWFNRVMLYTPLAVSNINVVKSLSVGIPSATSQNSSGTERFSYSHGITVFSRQNYAAQSTNFTTFTTASMGATFGLTYSSSSQTVNYSYVTNTTGGTTSFSTTSGSNNWSSYFTGPMLFPIPCLTTFQVGEYFFAHQHSSTTGTTGQNTTLMSISNLHIAPQVVGGLGVLQSSGTYASMNPWGMGAGIASAVTTNNSMAGSVVSGQTQNNIYMALSNA